MEVMARMGGTLVNDVSSGFRINPLTGSHITVTRADGATIELTGGRVLIDTFMAHGTTILGHHDRRVFAAVRDALEAGVLLGYETSLGATVADRLAGLLPGVDKIRFCTSGTEAVATTLRMCRAHTGKDLIIKMDGHYNGSSDYALMNSMWVASDPDLPVGTEARRIRSSNGIPTEAAESMILVPWNDPEALAHTLAEHASRVAAILMVPLDLNNGCIPPLPGYLEFARAQADKFRIPLIFDEVLAGFKTGVTGAAGLYGVTPDVSIWSKALSCGFPVSVIGGRADIMEVMGNPLPQGVLQGGTHAGNAIGLAAAQATLDILTEESFYPELLARANAFYQDLSQSLNAAGLPTRVQGEGLGYGVYIGTTEPINSVADIRRYVDHDLASDFFTACLDEGVYFHTDFTVTQAHTQPILDELVERATAAARRVVTGSAHTTTTTAGISA
jgi:glutamate-1-semialdehyde 2,1-aminomutase